MEAGNVKDFTKTFGQKLWKSWRRTYLGISVEKECHRSGLLIFFNFKQEKTFFFIFIKLRMKTVNLMFFRLKAGFGVKGMLRDKP